MQIVHVRAHAPAGVCWGQTSILVASCYSTQSSGKHALMNNKSDLPPLFFRSGYGPALLQHGASEDMKKSVSALLT